MPAPQDVYLQIAYTTSRLGVGRTRLNWRCARRASYFWSAPPSQPALAIQYCLVGSRRFDRLVDRLALHIKQKRAGSSGLYNELDDFERWTDNLPVGTSPFVRARPKARNDLAMNLPDAAGRLLHKTRMDWAGECLGEVRHVDD